MKEFSSSDKVFEFLDQKICLINLNATFNGPQQQTLKFLLRFVSLRQVNLFEIANLDASRLLYYIICVSATVAYGVNHFLLLIMFRALWLMLKSGRRRRFKNSKKP
uniref:Uncharacterized protein n=1 Tax=Glossina brevipalpis TaxID=37001 RepID=A0A1A9W8K1_9MUSC